MGARAILWLLGIFCGVQFVFGSQLWSKNEDLELQRALKLHSKPVVTTIKTKYGDEYNCVNFHQQPAFDHPKLKDRAFEFKMRPSSISSQDLWAAKIWENGKGCPSGTVPVRRYTKAHLIRAIKISKIHASNLNPTRDESSSDEEIEYLHARATSRDGEGPTYGGIAMEASLHNPNVSEIQYSSSQMKILAGKDLVQTGWTVNPSLNHDHRTRLFIFTKMNNKSCFNDLCPGFVRDSSKIPIDFVFEKLSVLGGEAYSWTFKISRDQSNGNWVLKFGANESNVAVGYWPKNLFTKTGLGRLATGIEWGGEVNHIRGQLFPKMGSGYRKFFRTSNLTAYCGKLEVQNKDGQMVNAPNNLNTFPEYPYKLTPVTNAGGVMQQFFFYGGPILPLSK